MKYLKVISNSGDKIYLQESKIYAISVHEGVATSPDCIEITMDNGKTYVVKDFVSAKSVDGVDVNNSTFGRANLEDFAEAMKSVTKERCHVK